MKKACALLILHLKFERKLRPMPDASYVNMGGDKDPGRSADALRQKLEVQTQMISIAARSAREKSLRFCEQKNILSTLNKLPSQNSGLMNWPSEARVEDQLNY